jgi:hypothetical protein
MLEEVVITPTKKTTTTKSTTPANKPAATSKPTVANTPAKTTTNKPAVVSNTNNQSNKPSAVKPAAPSTTATAAPTKTQSPAPAKTATTTPQGKTTVATAPGVKPLTPNTDISIVDYLESIGEDSSKAARMRLARDNGMNDYSYRGDQNIALIKILKDKAAKTGNAQVVTAGAALGTTTPAISTTPVAKPSLSSLAGLIPARNEEISATDRLVRPSTYTKPIMEKPQLNVLPSSMNVLRSGYNPPILPNAKFNSSGIAEKVAGKSTEDIRLDKIFRNSGGGLG